MEDKLKKLLKNIDEEGLEFLIQPASIIIHNKEIDNYNKEIVKSTNIEKKPDTYSLKIIPDDDKKNFVIQYNNTRKFFTRDEFREMVKISHMNINSNDRMFAWLHKERKDALIDFGIRDKNNKVLLDLIRQLNSSFKVKQ